MKKYSIYFLLFFSLSFVSSATLSISPPEINFTGEVGKTLCQKIIIETENFENLTGKDVWAQKGNAEKILQNHKLNSSELDLELIYPKKINLNKKEIITVCIKGKEKGIYHGALIYRIDKKPLEIGIWINVNLEGNSFIKLTGNAVGINEKINYKKSLIISIILLAIILILLLKKLRRKNEFS